VFSGGDPLKRDDAVDLVSYGTEIGLNVTMTPSGTASLDPDAVTELADAGLRRMALSIDGSNAARHDAFRGEAGSFAKTMQAAQAAREADLPLQVNTTVCRQTVADLGAVLWSDEIAASRSAGTAAD
jgi:MoaA/NifB/PqqE/SkfB family radical SAM enzyme